MGLASAFLAGVAPAARSGFEAPADPGEPSLEARLVSLVERARQDCPEVRVEIDAFLAHVGRHAPDTPAGLDGLHAGDLWLAFACAGGTSKACGRFEQRFGPDIAAAARRIIAPELSRDDMLQALREKLFMGDVQRPAKLLDYAGRGRLQNWVRITALRAFTDMARASRRRREDGDDELLRLADAKDMELSFLKDHYREAFRGAFEAAIGSLSAAQRNLLRYSWVRGASIDAIGTLLGVHRATAARRLDKARAALLAATRRELSAQLRLQNTEVDSVIRLIQSRLDMSLERLLAGAEGEAAQAAAAQPAQDEAPGRGEARS